MMSDSGLIQHWRQIHWPSIKQCQDTHQRNFIGKRTNKSEPKKISFNDLQSSFFHFEYWDAFISDDIFNRADSIQD